MNESNLPPSFAAGARLPFTELPDAVAEWVATVLGGAITDVVDKRGGFSPGVAAVVTTASGAHGFVKAVGSSINAESVQFHRAESAVMARLPPHDAILRPVASESIQIEADEWEVMIFPVIDGVTPRHPWLESDAVRVLDALVDLADRFTPSPWPEDPARTEKLVAFFRGWTRIDREGDDPWRSDPWISTHFADLVALEPLLAARLPGNTLSHTDRQPPPPGLPTIRAFQDVQAEAMLRYVIRRFPDGLATIS